MPSCPHPLLKWFGFFWAAALILLSAPSAEGQSEGRELAKAAILSNAIGYKEPPVGVASKPSLPHCTAGLYCANIPFSLGLPNPYATATSAWRNRVDNILQGLSAAAAVDPSDPWILQEQVFYLAHAERFKDADSLLAQRCAPVSAQCHALRGFLLHLQRSFAAAEHAFDSALAAMDAGAACEWRDILPILGTTTEPTDRTIFRRQASGEKITGRLEVRDTRFSRIAVLYEAMDCAHRDELAQTIWWLSDPLQTVPGNERRSAHFTRRVLFEIVQQEEQMVTGNQRAGDTLSLNKALRTGRTSNCLVHTADTCEGTSARLLEGLAHAFLVRDEIVLHPLAAMLGDSALHPPVVSEATGGRGKNQFSLPSPGGWSQAEGFIEAYGLVESYGSYFGPYHLIRDAQIAFLQRGDSAQVLAAFRPSTGSSMTNPEVQIGGAYSRDHNRLLRSASQGVRAQDIASVAIPAYLDTALVSLEAFAPGWGVARARFSASPSHTILEQRVGISDIVLFQPNGSNDPTSVAELMSLMLPALEASRNSTLGLYWELYGLAVHDTVDITITVEAMHVSLWSSLRGLLGSKPAIAREVSITDIMHEVPTEDWTARVVSLNMNSAQPGEYRLSVVARLRGQQDLVSSRTIVIK